MFDDHQFDAQQIESALPDYKFIKKLGVGSYGKVFLVSKKDNPDKQVALKKIKCFGLCDYEKTNAANEVRILASLNHPNVINFYESLFDNAEEDLYIFMEYAKDGDLSNLIAEAKEKKRRISEALIWKIIAQLADGLQYLHKNSIMHRDIKPANVFRADNQQFKLADLNVSKILPAGVLAKTQIGSPLYTSPEIWNSENGYSEKCDIWSLGVVVYELCTLKVPYEANSIDELIRKFKTQRLKNIPNGYSSTLNELIHEMLQINPKRRLSAEKIVSICQNHGKLHPSQAPSLQCSIQEQQNMLDTITFPESNPSEQRWINLVPLPPKMTKKQSSGSECFSTNIRENNSKEKRDSFQTSRSIVFAPVENKSTILRKSRGKVSGQSQEKLQRVRLPSISKRNSSHSIEERKSRGKEYKTPQKSNQSIEAVKCPSKMIVPQLPQPNPHKKSEKFLRPSVGIQNSIIA